MSNSAGEDHHESGIPEEVDELDGGQILGGGRVPSMDITNHDGDPIHEAINRDEYFDHVAIGEVRGHAVMVSARVPTSMGKLKEPRLTVTVGGNWDDETETYLSGKRHHRYFDTLWELDERFGELCREHGLVILPPEDGEQDE